MRRAGLGETRSQNRTKQRERTSQMQMAAGGLRRLLPPTARTAKVLESRDCPLGSGSPRMPAQRPTVLRPALGTPIAAVRRDHLDAGFPGPGVERITVARLGTHHRLVRCCRKHPIEELLHESTLVRRRGCRVDGDPRASTWTMISTPAPAFVHPRPSPPPRAVLNVPSMEHAQSLAPVRRSSQAARP